jgi:membrane protease YdiL (CAAX protease family)
LDYISVGLRFQPDGDERKAGFPDYAGWEICVKCESINVSPASGGRQGERTRTEMSTNSPTPENAAGFRLAVLVEGAMGLAALGLAKLFDVSLREQFAADPKVLWRGLVAGAIATLPMFFLFWAMLESRWQPLVDLKQQVREMIRTLFPRASVVELAIIAVLAGVGEELLFRGVIQTLVGRWTSPLIGLVIASLIFGALHAVSRLYFILATLTGAYLGWLLVQFDDLTVPIVAHGLYDFVAFVYLTRTQESEAPL